MAVQWKKILFSGDIALSDFPTQATATVLGNRSGSTAVPSAMTVAQTLTLLSVESGADVTDAANVLAAGALMDNELTTIALVKGLAAGISDGNVITANDAVADDDYLQINGTEIEGRTYSQVRSDLGIEAGATADQTADEIGVLFAADNTTVRFGGNITVDGDITVSGTTITTATETLEIADNKMVINSDLGNSVAEPAAGAGFTVNRGVTTTGSVGSPAGNHWTLKALGGKWRIGEATNNALSGGTYTEHGMVVPKIEKAGAPSTEKAGGAHHGFCADTSNNALYWRIGDSVG